MSKTRTESSSDKEMGFVGNWQEVPLYDLAEWKNGLAFKDISFTETGKPVIKIAELKYGITAQTRFTHDEFDISVALTKGDMLFSWSGNPETSIDVFYYELQDGWLNQHIFKVTPRDVDRNYLYYILKFLKPTFTAIASNKQTTGLGHVTVKDMKDLMIRLPVTISEQRTIVAQLVALDAKIAANNKVNHHLAPLRSATDSSPDIRRGKSESLIATSLLFSLLLMLSVWNIGLTVSSHFNWTSMGGIGTTIAFRCDDGRAMEGTPV
jgi:type I restriction enzyme S subunit